VELAGPSAEPHLAEAEAARSGQERAHSPGGAQPRLGGTTEPPAPRWGQRAARADTVDHWEARQWPWRMGGGGALAIEREQAGARMRAGAWRALLVSAALFGMLMTPWPHAGALITHQK